MRQGRVAGSKMTAWFLFYPIFFPLYLERYHDVAVSLFRQRHLLHVRSCRACQPFSVAVKHAAVARTVKLLFFLIEIENAPQVRALGGKGEQAAIVFY